VQDESGIPKEINVAMAGGIRSPIRLAGASSA
jgi:hypothetical protein